VSKIKQQDRFNFFVPLQFEKGSDGNGKYLLKIKGIASSKTEDSDGEVLDPIGFDVDPLLKSGMINWNHQGSKTSAAICGKPTFAKVINNGQDLYLEGVIFNNTEGRSVSELIQVLEDEPDRQLGWSIEGVATERDIFNPKKIKKAKLSGVALTHVPKNKNTFVSILKGEYSEPFINDEELEEEEIEIPEPIKSIFTEAKNKIKNIIFNSKKKTEKAITTQTIAPATPESVDHNPKDITNNQVSNNDKFGKLIKKSDIYISILKSFPESIADINKIYSFVEEVNSKLFKMESNMITEDALQKAFDLLNEASVLVKGRDEKEMKPDNEMKDMKKSDEMEYSDEDMEKAMGTAKVLHKAGMDKDGACDMMKKGGIPLMVAQGAWEKVISETNAVANGGDPMQMAGAMMKGEVFETLKAEPLINIQEEIKKSLDPLTQDLGGVKEAISKGFDGLNTIIKSLQDQNLELKKSNSELCERIEKISGTPMPKKSVTTAKAIERFEKSDDGVKDENCFNITNKQDLDRLADRLLAEIDVQFQKSEKIDQLLEGTINEIEIRGIVPQYAYPRLAAMGIKLQVPSI
jgi:hypothetical protein